MTYDLGFEIGSLRFKFNLIQSLSIYINPYQQFNDSTLQRSKDSAIFSRLSDN